MFRRSFPLVILHSSFVMAANAAPVDYDRDIRPFLKDNCIACHNKTTTKGGLNMETPELMMKGGDSDKGIIPGKGADSIIYQAAAQTWDSEMPPKNNKVSAVPLTPPQLALLKAWINEGAKASEKAARSLTWEPLPAALQPAYAIAVTAQGDFAAVARANQISLYHLPTHSLVTKLTDETLIKSGLYKNPGVAHHDLVQSIAFSPDGMRLATGSFREVKLWKRVPPQITAAPSTKLSVVQEADNSLKITETASGKLVAQVKTDLAGEQALAQRSLAAGRAALEVVAQSAAIKRAETEVTDQTNRLKKAHELAVTAKKTLEDRQRELKAKADAKAAADKAVPAPEPKPDDKKLAEAREKAGKAASEFAAAQEALKRAENAVTDTAEEIQVVTANEAKARQAVVNAKARLAVLQKEQTQAVAEREAAAKALAQGLKKAKTLGFSANGLEVIAEYEGAPPQAWNAANGKPITPGDTSTAWTLERMLGTGDDKSAITDRANSLAFSPDGRTLAIGSGEPSRSGDITLWDVAGGKLVKTYAERHLDSVLALDFSPDGRLLASGGADKMVRVTDLASGKVLKVFEGHTHHVLGLTWRADGRVLASAGADNVVKIWDWVTGERRKNVDGWDKEITGIRYLGTADQFATSAGDHKLRVINSEGGEVKQIPGAAGFLQSLGTSSFGNVILVGDQEGVVRAWDVATAKEIAVFKP